jgi:hypothetical protein
MNIKTLIHQLHRELEQTSKSSLPRSQLYEGLAAGFGYATYAALSTEAVFDDGHPTPSIDAEAVQKRLRGLGVAPEAADMAAEQLNAAAVATGLAVVKIRDLVLRLLGDARTDDEWDDHESVGIDDLSALHRDSLVRAADRGNALAAYAMARLLSNAMDEDDAPKGSHWHQQMKAGQPLNAMEQEFATEYVEWLEARASYERYLTTAARGKIADACVEAAYRFDDPTWLQDCDPWKLFAPLAALVVFDHHGRRDLSFEACRRAALCGDSEAIELMLAEYDAESAIHAQGWIYFAEAQGIELEDLEPRAYAIHEDGSRYDDDIGGPIYAVEDRGLRPAPLEPKEDAQARNYAAALAAEAATFGSQD